MPRAPRYASRQRSTCSARERPSGYPFVQKVVYRISISCSPGPIPRANSRICPHSGSTFPILSNSGSSLSKASPKCLSMTSPLTSSIMASSIQRSSASNFSSRARVRWTMSGYPTGNPTMTMSFDNPYISMLRTAWHYARRERKKYVLVYAMFAFENVIIAMNPILLGWFVDMIQHNTTRVLYYAFLYAGCFIGLKFLQWCLHGPARVMERTLAFNLSRNFLQERYHQLLHLPVKWHQDHHSGATINRIRKAYEALREFFDRGFMYVYVLGKFLFSVTAMLYFSPLFGGLA